MTLKLPHKAKPPGGVMLLVPRDNKKIAIRIFFLLIFQNLCLVTRLVGQAFGQEFLVDGVKKNRVCGFCWVA